MVQITAPLSPSAIVRLDRDTGTLRTRRYLLEVLSGQHKGATVELHGTLLVGSHPDNGLVLTDPTVSRYHLELRVRDDGVSVRDAKSKNGTFLGKTRVESVVVARE